MSDYWVLVMGNLIAEFLLFELNANDLWCRTFSLRRGILETRRPRLTGFGRIPFLGKHHFAKAGTLRIRNDTTTSVCGSDRSYRNLVHWHLRYDAP